LVSNVGAAAVVLGLALAPFQCARKGDPELHMEDDAGEALYDLAERFHASGDAKARAETLRYLIERYPSSRFAASARVDLREPAR
jgi:TolA-binding protein